VTDAIKRKNKNKQNINAITFHTDTINKNIYFGTYLINDNLYNLLFLAVYSIILRYKNEFVTIINWLALKPKEMIFSPLPI